MPEEPIVVKPVSVSVDNAEYRRGFRHGFRSASKQSHKPYQRTEREHASQVQIPPASAQSVEPQSIIGRLFGR